MNTEEMILPQMLTINQAARESNMTYNAVRQLCISGAIKTIRVGVGKEKRKYLINRTSLYRYLNDEK